MLYWCEAYIYGYGYSYSYGFNYCYGYDSGCSGGVSPAMLVIGVKLEEVVLNAVLV